MSLLANLYAADSFVRNQFNELVMRLMSEPEPVNRNKSLDHFAKASGLSSGTLSMDHQVSSFGDLFERVAVNQSAEMNERIAQACKDVHDPALRLAFGIRLYLQRAKDEPQWGQLLLGFGLRPAAVKALLTGVAASDLVLGMNARGYAIEAHQLRPAIALISGAVIGAVSLLLNEDEPVNPLAQDTAELVLRALGMPHDLAKAYSLMPMRAVCT